MAQNTVEDSLSEYLWVIVYCAWIVSPVALCCCFPAGKVINKFEKELLSANLGSMCGFIFFEIVPVIIRDDIKDETQIYFVSCTILIGMLFGFFLSMLHQLMEHNHEPKPIQTTCKPEGEQPKSNCLSCYVLYIFTLKKFLKISENLFDSSS